MAADKPSSALDAYISLHLALPPAPSRPDAADHILYLRADNHSVPTPDSPRSLFLSNVPVDSSEAAFRAFFKQLGGLVERVAFEDDNAENAQIRVKGQVWDEQTDKKGSKKRKRGTEQDGDIVSTAKVLPSTWSCQTQRSGSSAVVVFVDRATADTVMKECRKRAKKGLSVPWTQAHELGLARYKEHHSLTYPPRDELKAKVNSYLAEYAILEEVRSKKMKQLRNEPDEDGFVTVVRGGRTGPARMEDAKAAKERMMEREKKRIGATFYRFQTREEAKKRERDLREKFENDAKKLKEMRQRKGAIRPES
ncbi:hypothetical protein BT63DRAFT_270986 [Microthyrium microscopicum]|uniref:RRM domain-containing protein n=1 Tax=Microthyrium microscopicum TaxID=703497 RepID=A0A6A6UAQ8_9PEZI|nr:hypothetical protein BT63DRAFT_270986 [Microthyrium microscopicum]